MKRHLRRLALAWSAVAAAAALYWLETTLPVIEVLVLLAPGLLMLGLLYRYLLKESDQ